MNKTKTLDGRKKDSLPTPKRTVTPFVAPGAARGAYSPSYRNPRSGTSPNTIAREEAIARQLEAARKERAKGGMLQAPGRSARRARQRATVTDV